MAAEWESSGSRTKKLAWDSRPRGQKWPCGLLQLLQPPLPLATAWLGSLEAVMRQGGASKAEKRGAAWPARPAVAASPGGQRSPACKAAQGPHPLVQGRWRLARHTMLGSKPPHCPCCGAPLSNLPALPRPRCAAAGPPYFASEARQQGQQASWQRRLPAACGGSSWSTCRCSWTSAAG